MVNISLLFAIYTFMITAKKTVVCGKMPALNKNTQKLTGT